MKVQQCIGITNQKEPAECLFSYEVSCHCLTLYCTKLLALQNETMYRQVLLFFAISLSRDLKFTPFFLELRDSFRFNAVWHRWSMAALLFCMMLAESDVIHAISYMFVLITLVIKSRGSYRLFFLPTWVRNANLHPQCNPSEKQPKSQI